MRAHGVKRHICVWEKNYMVDSERQNMKLYHSYIYINIIYIILL